MDLIHDLIHLSFCMFLAHLQFHENLPGPSCSSFEWGLRAFSFALAESTTLQVSAHERERVGLQRQLLRAPWLQRAWTVSILMVGINIIQKWWERVSYLACDCFVYIGINCCILLTSLP